MLVPSPLLTIRGPESAAEADALLKDQDDIRSRLFYRTGVLLPLIGFEPDAAAVAPQEWEIHLNGQRIWSGSRTIAPDASATFMLEFSLEPHMTEFIVPLLVEQYLEQLSEGYPKLVRTVRAAYSVDRLTELLRERFKTHRSIRDFRGALEEFMRATVSQPATPV